MGGVPDERFMIVGNSCVVYLELGTSMGEEWNMWAITAMLCLVFACGGVCIHVELGEEREAIIGHVAILVPFDVLDGGAES